MEKKKLSLYLAHQYKYQNEVRPIELDLEKNFDINLDNPFYDQHRNDLNTTDKTLKRRYNYTKKIKRQIRENDLDMIRKNEGILCFIFDYQALGSYQEMFYCSYIEHKPVYLITPLEHVRKHIWTVDYHCFRTLDEFKRWLKKNGYKKEVS